VAYREIESYGRLVLAGKNFSVQLKYGSKICAFRGSFSLGDRRDRAWLPHRSPISISIVQGSGRMTVEWLSNALGQREENLGLITTPGSQLQHTTVGQQAIVVANQGLDMAQGCNELFFKITAEL